MKKFNTRHDIKGVGGKGIAQEPSKVELRLKLWKKSLALSNGEIFALTKGKALEGNTEDRDIKREQIMGLLLERSST